MKKNLITFFSLSILTFSLVGCDEEPQNSQEKKNDEPIAEQKRTVFSTGDDITRTSMDANRKFYWTTGDQIWVETSTGTYESTDDSRLSDDRKTADFYLSTALTEKKYPVYYTGNGSKSATRVTIKSPQTQEEWDNADHIGTSGDCGVAEAEKQDNGRYTFSLKHKASYLIFQPYKPDRITDDWKLLNIEITDDDGKKLRGTYPFSKDGLDIENSSYAYQSVTLNLGSNGFSLPNTTESTANRKSCFAVIQPSGGEVRNLTIRYTIKPTRSVNYTQGGTFTITKKLSKSFSVNGVTIIRHELSAEAYSTDHFYMWDAEKPYFYGVSNENRTLWYGAQTPDYPTPSTTDRYSNPTILPASNSCKDLPNANAVSWYLLAGDPRWESEGPPWYYAENGGSAVYTYGAWLLKWENIEGKPEGSTITDCGESYWGNDIRVDGIPYGQSPSSYVTTSSYTSGRTPTDLSKYFFLPAMGYLTNSFKNDGYEELTPSWSFSGCYWSSTPRNSGHDEAYVLDFARNNIRIETMTKTLGYIAAPTGWFQ